MDFKRNGNLEDTPFIGKIKIPEGKTEACKKSMKEDDDPIVSFQKHYQREICDTTDAITKWINSQDSGDAQMIAFISLFLTTASLDADVPTDTKVAAAKASAAYLAAHSSAMRNIIKEKMGGLPDFLKDILRGGVLNRGR